MDVKCLSTASCECKHEMCINKGLSLSNCLCELKVFCTTTKCFVFLCCFVMGCGGSIVDAYYLFAKLEHLIYCV